MDFTVTRYWPGAIYSGRVARMPKIFSSYSIFERGSGLPREDKSSKMIESKMDSGSRSSEKSTRMDSLERTTEFLCGKIFAITGGVASSDME